MRAPERIINIQDAFLNYMRKNKQPVTIFLLNGVKISGTIACFDQHSIVIRREGYTQLLYKHAISTFTPHGTVSIFDWNNQSQNTSARHRGAPGSDDEEDDENIDEIAIDSEEYDYGDGEE
jgi:host factor-I protein